MINTCFNYRKIIFLKDLLLQILVLNGSFVFLKFKSNVISLINHANIVYKIKIIL